MQLKVKNLGGVIIPIDVEASYTIEKLKEKIEEKEGIPPAQQRLIFAGKPMSENKTVADYKLTAGCTIHLVLAL